MFLSIFTVYLQVLWNLPPHIRINNAFLIPFGILPQGISGKELAHFLAPLEEFAIELNSGAL
jgi:hypothetical protein